ncbi:MAG: hypothetical protein COV70_01400 [Parcubacteria group bacterium CG11_big_fil_rev_8_21_14_0_20_39_22]|nr:MAG: hypothetical protein COV70_01400 [Parcubacteria group bacterium CG11_big_fil_rev_8_21_14_0_20_39_22]
MEKLKNKKTVITGGAGFIGSHIAEALIEKGSEVHIIDDLSGGKEENIPKEAIFHNLDISDYDSIAPIFKDAEVVFHAAALPRVQYSIENPRESNHANVTGTVNILTASKEAGVKRVVYSASSSAYGDQDAMPLTEDMPANPKSPYGLQKYIGELYCKVWSDIYDMTTVSLRYFNVYGPRMNQEGAYALAIGKFFKQRSEGKPITITGDGTQTRDFTHVRDVVRANIAAAISENIKGGEVFNIGAGRNFSINDLAKLIGGPVEYIPARLEPHDTLADNSKARNILGWEPQIKLEDGINELKDIYNLK